MSDDLMDDLRDFHDHCIATGNLELSELIKNSYLKMDDLESNKSGLEGDIELLKADNALLKTAGEDLLEAVKDSNIHLSKSTEVVSLLKDKVKELVSLLTEYKMYGEIALEEDGFSDRVDKALTINRGIE